jgi:hypothetical protein
MALKRKYLGTKMWVFRNGQQEKQRRFLIVIRHLCLPLLLMEEQREKVCLGKTINIPRYFATLWRIKGAISPFRSG